MIENTIIEEDSDEEFILEDDNYKPDDSLGIKSSKSNVIYYDGQETITNLFYDRLSYIPNRQHFCNDGMGLKGLAPNNGMGLKGLASNNGMGLKGLTSNNGMGLKGLAPNNGMGLKGLAPNNGMIFMPNDIIDTIGRDGKYVMIIYGILPDGTKTELTITDIRVFFDIMVPRDKTANAFNSLLTGILMMDAPDSIIESIEAYPLKGYNETKIPYKRIYNKNLENRKKAMDIVLAAGFQTASDDNKRYYYRKVARETGLLLSDWMIISSYVNANASTYVNANASTYPNANANADIYKISANIKDIKNIDAKEKQSDQLLIHDRTMVMTWDIETYSERNMGDLPLAHHDEDNAFMICMTFHWKDELVSLLQICITNFETDPDDRWITIICRNDFKNIIKAFALCFEMMRPDIMYGFNDSEYDWPFIIEKAKKLSILEWMWNKMSISYRKVSADIITRFYIVNKQQIKITNEATSYCTYLKIIGCIMIDVRVCLRKLYPKAEKTSLKYFLELCKLGGKADMPIKKMWTFYRNAAAVAVNRNAAAVNAINRNAAAVNTTSASEGMRHIAHYCVIDALRCQELMLKRGILNDLREVTTLAHMSVFDAHYFAGGKRVCNLLGAYANKRGILISMIAKYNPEKGKYPGAFVFNPDKGPTPDPTKVSAIENAVMSGKEVLDDEFKDFDRERPVVGLDFNSLYPSLIETYNLSPEKIIIDTEKANQYRELGYPLYEIDFMYGERNVIGWSILHNNEESKIGLYPSVLIDLSNKRAEMKKVLAKYKSIKEVMDGIFGKAKSDSKVKLDSKVKENENSNLKDIILSMRSDSVYELNYISQLDDASIIISPGSTLEEEKEDNKRKIKIIKERLTIFNNLLELDTEENGGESFIKNIYSYYDNAVFECTCANVKQNAVKIYMNTFYGEAGNSISPFFLLELAGGVTSSGQYNIKLVAKFVQELGFHIKYGDTDSLYLVPPSYYFKECDADYVNALILLRDGNNKSNRDTITENYWTAMVKITMRVMNNLKTEVNQYLYEDNGSPYLKMAYEEVLYPVVFTGKKKYYGIAHENEINFHPNHLFIRGIDIIKQGQSGLAKIIGNKIMWESMSISNRKTVRMIVEDILKDAVLNKSQWTFEDFIKCDAWRPNKMNISVHIFMKRMKIHSDIETAEMKKKSQLGKATTAPLYEIPEAGDRFNYVIVKKDAVSDMFDIHGRKIAIKKGDRMEFVPVAKHFNLPIDIAFYMINYVAGVCARFINYDNEFSQEDTSDEVSQKSAKQYLENFIKRLDNIDPTVIRQRGNLYKKAFSSVIKKSKEGLSPLIANMFHGKFINYELLAMNTDGDVARFYETINNNIYKYIEKYYTIQINTFCNNLLKQMGIINSNGDINTKKLYKWQIFINKSSKINNILEDFSQNINYLNIIAIKYENILIKKINNERAYLEVGPASNDLEEVINFFDIITEDEKNVLITFRTYLMKIFGINSVKIKTETLMKQITDIKNTRLKISMRPNASEQKKVIKESANIYFSICGDVSL